MREVLHFLVHLRLHYQLFILSGPFLLAGVYASTINWPRFIGQFFVVQILLFGGATAFNSYWDHDTGPIGGLRHPPPMRPWMRWASLALQAAGLPLAMPLGSLYTLLYVASMVFFWLYSSPVARWKGAPYLSILAVAVSTGSNPFLMGSVAATMTPPGLSKVLAAAGVSLLLVSMYPVSQVFQIEEDRYRNDRTFAVVHGLKGVRVLFVACYFAGLGIVGGTLFEVDETLGAILGLAGGCGGLVTACQLWRLEGAAAEYDRVMRLKYSTSFLFVGFIVWALVWQSYGTVSP